MDIKVLILTYYIHLKNNVIILKGGLLIRIKKQYTMVSKSNIIKKKSMISALERSLGVVTIACKEVGIARKTHYEWYKEDEDYRNAVDDLVDVALDFAESMLHKQIQEKDTTATIFYLKTKGKKRGYIERSEIDHSGGVNLHYDKQDEKL